MPPKKQGGDDTSTNVTTEDAGFPLGTFTRCARGGRSTDSAFLASSGIEAGATLTLVQNGAAMTATFSDSDGRQSSLSVDAQTKDVATLAHPSSVPSNMKSSCVISLGNIQHSPTDLNLTDATLTHDASTVFLWARGIASDVEPTTCGEHSSPADYWLICEKGDTASAASAPAPAPAQTIEPAFPTGSFDCASQIGTYYRNGTMDSYGTSGRNGTLTLAQNGNDLTASYDGDMFLEGTMQFVPTGASSARIVPKQSLSARCDVAVGDLDVPTVPTGAETLAVDAGSLAVDGSTLYLSVTGTTGNGACPHAKKMATLICTKQ